MAAQLLQHSKKLAIVQDWLGRHYVFYCLLVTVSALVIRFYWGREIYLSGMGSDDFGNIRKSIYYPRGDFLIDGLAGDKQNHYGGLLYPLIIMLWQLFATTIAKTQAIFVVNSVLAAGTTFLSCLIMMRLTQVRSFFAPWVIASCVPLFVLTYAALVENLLFVFVILTGWILIKLSTNPSDKKWLVLLLLATAAAPLVRQPGLSVGAAAIVAVVFSDFAALKKRLALAALILVSMLPSVLVGRWIGALLGKQRESIYVEQVGQFLDSFSDIPVLISLGYNQMLYIVFAAGLLPALALLFLINGRLKDYFHRDHIYTCYALATTVIFVTFCLVHLIIKFDLDPQQARFVFGRYDDPAVIVLLPLGIALLLNRRESSFWLRLGFAIIMGVITYFSVQRAFVSDGLTLNVSGYFFPHRTWWVATYGPLIGAVFVVICFVWSHRWLWETVFLCLLLLNGLAINNGINFFEGKTSSSYRLVEKLNNWIKSSTTADECVVFYTPPAKTKSKQKFDVRTFRMVVFAAYPKVILKEEISTEAEKLCPVFLAPETTENIPASWQEIVRSSGYVMWRKGN